MSSTGRRILTALIALPVALSEVFFAKGALSFAVFLAVFWMAAAELLPMARHITPSAPLKSLLVWIPATSILGFLLLESGLQAIPAWWLATAISLIVALAGCTALLTHTDVRDGLATMGILAFATPLFAVPPVLISWLQAYDPWLLFALLAIVWLGDTAAWSIGKAIGRHKLAPGVSPKKTWEGSTAGLVAGVLSMVVWSQWRLGEIVPELLIVAALTSVAAQLSDLMESVIKRGAGIKDSSNLLPGHGGFFDRLDAMLLATPVYVVGLHSVGIESLLLAP